LLLEPHKRKFCKLRRWKVKVGELKTISRIVTTCINVLNHIHFYFTNKGNFLQKTRWRREISYKGREILSFVGDAVQFPYLVVAILPTFSVTVAECRMATLLPILYFVFSSVLLGVINTALSGCTIDPTTIL
jgi:hypothetical protein